MENNNIIQEIDYKRIRKIEEIREKYFNKLPDNKNNTPISSFLTTLGLFLFVSSFISHFIVKEKESSDMLTSFLIKYNSLSVYIFFFVVFTAVFGRFIATKEKMKRIRKVENADLSVAFFVDKLKGTELEISGEDCKAYNIFLERYINYFILKEKVLLDKSPSNYFDKTYVSSLTVDELFISAFVYPTCSSFIYIDTSGGD